MESRSRLSGRTSDRTQIMIDRNARRQAGALLRHLAAGRLTNDEFEDRFPFPSGDTAVNELRCAAWYLYDDRREYRLVGKDRLSAEARREVARWVLFLLTALEYEWPVRSRWTTVLLAIGNFCTLGIIGTLWRSRCHRRGDIGVWPFIRRPDYEAALAASGLLRRAV